MHKMILMTLFGAMLASTPVVGMAKAVESKDTFSLEFFQKIAAARAQENFVLSGESLETVLLMLQDGATGNTQRELSLALCGKDQLCQGVAPSANEGYKAANAIWVQEGFAILPQYRSQITEQYHGDVLSVNFRNDKQKAVEQINAWAKKNTEGLISQILTPNDVNAMTALVLTNALYFEGFWPKVFDEKETADKPFTTVNGKSVNVPTMVKNDKYFMAKQNGVQLVGLPYRDNNLEMLVMLPEDAKKYPEFVKGLTDEKIQGLVNAQQETTVTLFMPKFTIESSYDDLKSTLQSMGIKKVFSTEAELKKINEKEPLYLSKVLQKAIIKVDEKGTKAAAVTAGVVMTRALAPNLFHIDRPFVFAIYNQKTHKIVFMGQVVNPKK